MPYEVTDLAAFARAPFDTVIDVRSPAEFAEDHLPGAINLPALSDAERARVGTIYKQVSPFEARKVGAALVTRNVARHLEGPLASKPGAWQPLVYCWRGGQRSGSVAVILRQIGWRAETLAGGYRAYRRRVVEMLHDGPVPHRLIVLDGNTGTGKTALLAHLRALGVQVLDLEALAAHRGSIFGPSRGTAQPTQKTFETRIAQALAQMDPARPLVLENESAKIGDVLIPPALWAAMCATPAIDVVATASARAAYLCRAYRDVTANRAALDATLTRLVPFHGAAKVAAWRALAQAGEDRALAEALITTHYDPRYAKWRRGHDRQVLTQVAFSELTEDEIGARAQDIAGLLASPGCVDQRRDWRMPSTI